MTITSPSAVPAWSHDNPALGVAAALWAIMLFSLMDAGVKWLGADYPVQQIMFFRCTVALLPILVFLHQAGGLPVLKSRRPGLHLLRSLLGVSAMGCAFHGFSVMQLADAASVFYTAPLLAVAFSVPLLGERVGVRRWSAVLAGLMGALIVARPGGEVFSQGGVYMLAAAILVGLTTNLIRKLSRTEHPVSITFYFTASGVVLAGTACWLLGWKTPDRFGLLLLMGVGLVGGIAQYAMTQSFRYAEVGLISPLKYLSIVLGGILGYLVWSEVPSRLTLLGVGIILSSGLYTIHRETLVARRRSTAVHPAPAPV